MPEGDTIRRLADKITARFAGQRCERTVTRDPRLVGVDFTGARLLEAQAYGKHLLIRWDDGRTLAGHLLMTGSWSVGPISSEPEWRRRVELWMQDGRLTGEMVPILRVLRTADEEQLIGHLGPDLCGPTPPDPALIAERFADFADAPLASAMLDQRVVAGFGNVYAVEVPFLVGVSPFHRTGDVDDVEALVGLGAALIRTNARLGPQNTTGRRMRDSAHFVYGAAGRPCPICGTRIEGAGEQQTPWRRVTAWCPSCQHHRRSGPIGTATVDLSRADRLLALHPARKDPLWPRPTGPGASHGGFDRS